MAIMNIMTMNDPLVKEYLETLQNRSELLPIPIMKIRSRLLIEDRKKRLMWTSLNVDVKIPNVWWVGLPIAILGLIVRSPGIMIAGAVILACGSLWSTWFMYFAFKKGLRRFGYKGVVKFVGPDKALGVFVDGTK